MRSNLFFFVFVQFLGIMLVSEMISQTRCTQSSTPVPLPGNIKLLDSYVHEKRKGIDTDVGSITKNGGLEIRYDIGPLAGNATGLYAMVNKDKLLWYKGQYFNGDELWTAAFKDGFIMATFVKSDANFFATTKTSEDIVEFFLTIMTYVPDKDYTKKWEERKKLVRKPSNN